MPPADFRPIFVETVHELSPPSACETGEDDVVWSVEYLARGPLWYHFTGHRVRDIVVAAGHSFDARTGHIKQVDPSILSFVLSDFQNNALIAAYFGDRKVSAQIATDTSKGRPSASEIVKVSLKREQSLDAVWAVSQTIFAFVGLERLEHFEYEAADNGLAASMDAISPHWCRGRITLPSAVMNG